MSVGRLPRLVVSGMLVAVLGLPLGCGDDQGQLVATPVTAVPGPYDFDYTIPEGTAYLIDLGEDPKIMPVGIDAKVGQTIRIINDDIESHTVGTFYVLAGSTLTYRFQTAGVFQGVCSTNPSDTFILTVTE